MRYLGLVFSLLLTGCQSNTTAEVTPRQSLMAEVASFQQELQDVRQHYLQLLDSKKQLVAHGQWEPQHLHLHIQQQRTYLEQTIQRYQVSLSKLEHRGPELFDNWRTQLPDALSSNTQGIDPNLAYIHSHARFDSTVSSAHYADATLQELLSRLKNSEQYLERNPNPRAASEVVKQTERLERATYRAVTALEQVEKATQAYLELEQAS
ncbi:DUF2959 family protein [Aliagarivorans taiwanensis]|uniref:DUF2959 family protein n=1 Tax=Aliagarivorans taiwanensis TaxID=561966 RepID=UPI0012F9C683|nr:DUF2959 family protein [Aliagarivorans taiwanensis]